MRHSRATRSADRISHSVILLAGALCGVFVFFVALPLAQSSPFPVPTQQQWVRKDQTYQLASAVSTPATLSTQVAVSRQVVVGIRGDREAAPGPRAQAVEPKVVLASAGPVTISMPARDAAPQDGDPDVTGSIPNATPPDVVTPKLVPAKLTPPPVTSPKLVPQKPRDVMEEVDDYLWKVYQREPRKKDSTGDFTWKDPAAAKHMGKSLKAYVIEGMDRDFREQLYHAGRAMDAAGLHWSMLSAFRDDYRQQIAEGFKARTGNSLHGGSRATCGYGCGRAMDVTSVNGGQDGAVWRWFDKNGAKYGLLRPMPGADPAHIQPRGDWHRIAAALRHDRTGTTDVAAAPAGKPKVAAEHRSRRRGRRG